MKKAFALLIITLITVSVVNASTDRRHRKHKRKKVVVNHYNVGRTKSGHKAYGCFEIF